MDKHKAHDLLHGNASETCPVCNGTYKEEAEIITAAEELLVKSEEPSQPLDAVPTEVKTEEPSTPEEIKAGETQITLPPTKKVYPVGVMTDVMSFSEGEKTVPSRIKIIPTGKFKTPKYGDLEITQEMLMEMKQNFESSVRAGGSTTGLPIDVEHGETAHRDAAAGWMKRLDIQADGAYADVEWTSLGKDLLEKGLYKFFSPEFVFDYIDNEQSVYFANVVTGGGLVNKPLFDHSLPPVMFSEDGTAKNLTKPTAPLMLFITHHNSSELPKDIQSNSILSASEKEEPMDLQTILAKEKSARTSDEQTFVAANLDQLTDEQKVAEGFAVVSASESKEVVPDVKVEEAAPETTVTASEANSTVISAAEVHALKERLAAAEREALEAKKSAEQGVLAFAELEAKKIELKKIEITEEIKAFTFSEKGGKIAPAQVEPLVGLMMTMNDGQRAELKGILESLPERQIFGEKGSDADVSKNQAGDILTAKISEKRGELVKATPTLSFSEATRQATLSVVAENPELYKDSRHSVKAY